MASASSTLFIQVKCFYYRFRGKACTSAHYRQLMFPAAAALEKWCALWATVEAGTLHISEHLSTSQD